MMRFSSTSNGVECSGPRLYIWCLYQWTEGKTERKKNSSFIRLFQTAYVHVVNTNMAQSVSEPTCIQRMRMKWWTKKNCLKSFDYVMIKRAARTWCNCRHIFNLFHKRPFTSFKRSLSLNYPFLFFISLSSESRILNLPEFNRGSKADEHWIFQLNIWYTKILR